METDDWDPFADPADVAADDAHLSSQSIQSNQIRFWAISDVHTDNKDNLKWLQRLSTSRYRNDVLLLAGDVAHKLDLLEETPCHRKRTFLSRLLCAWQPRPLGESW